MTGDRFPDLETETGRKIAGSEAGKWEMGLIRGSLSLPPILTRLVEQTPIAVMVRPQLERVVGAEALDAWFEEQCTGQYTRQLLFSTMFRPFCDLSHW